MSTVHDLAAALRARLSELRYARDLLTYLTPEQRHQRALFEAKMRANRLRGVPSCFDERPMMSADGGKDIPL